MVTPLRLVLAALVAGCVLSAAPSTAAATDVTPQAAETETGEPTPTDESTPTPEPTPTATPTATATTPPTDTAGPSPTATTTESATATPTDDATGTPTTDATTEPTTTPSDTGGPEESEPDEPEVIEPIPPAATTRTVPVVSWSIALGVLLASALVLLVLRLPAQPPVVTATVPSGPPSSSRDTFDAIEATGAAMIDAGYSVGTVEDALRDIARVNGFPSTQILVFPNALIVSARGEEELRTGAVASGTRPLLLHQIDALDRLVARARAGTADPLEIRSAIESLRSLEPPYSRVQRLAAYSLVCVALAVLLGASWLGLAVAGVLGVAVGAVLLLRSQALQVYRPLITVTLALAVSTTVMLLVRLGWDPGVLPSMIAPMVILLPGALLTTGVLELSSGHLMSGAGRLAAGAMQLVLLGIGFVAGALLVGVPRIELAEAASPLGEVAPWLAVAVFGIGIMVYQAGRARSIPWVVLVLYVAYGAQVLGSVFLGGVLSALVGALAMTPVAYLVSRRDTGPAPLVSFLPAFWLLVPGALGLVGVTTILSGDSAGMDTLVTTTATMVGIALGILAGSALSARVSPV